MGQKSFYKHNYCGVGFILLVLLVFLLSGAKNGICGDSDKEQQFLYGAKIGVLAHDVDGLWSGSSNEDGVDLNVELIFAPSLSVFSGKLRPAVGASINTSGDTSKIYLDGIWQIDLQQFFFSFGLGVAIHNGELHLVSEEKKALGSSVLFHIPIELGYKFNTSTTISIYFDHISNGNTQPENEGLDTLGVRLGYIF
jgi:hypothetical protein